MKLIQTAFGQNSPDNNLNTSQSHQTNDIYTPDKYLNAAIDSSEQVKLRLGSFLPPISQKSPGLVTPNIDDGSFTENQTGSKQQLESADNDASIQ